LCKTFGIASTKSLHFFFFEFGLGCAPTGMAVDLDFSLVCNILSVGLDRRCNEYSVLYYKTIYVVILETLRST
jgi:hypothetical protein